MNDIDPEILARDVLLLEIINTVDVEKEEDFKFLWAVWYNLELSPEHYQRLTTLIDRSGTFFYCLVIETFSCILLKFLQISGQAVIYLCCEP